jgi:hypothetical protein
LFSSHAMETLDEVGISPLFAPCTPPDWEESSPDSMFAVEPDGGLTSLAAPTMDDATTTTCCNSVVAGDIEVDEDAESAAFFDNLDEFVAPGHCEDKGRSIRGDSRFIESGGGLGSKGLCEFRGSRQVHTSPKTSSNSIDRFLCRKRRNLKMSIESTRTPTGQSWASTPSLPDSR